MPAEFGTQILLNAIPMPAFIVDEDLAVNSVNHTAIDVFNLKGHCIPHEERLGDLLQCVRASDDPSGCGYGIECKQCILLGTVLECYKGYPVIQRKATIELKGEEWNTCCEFVISANQINNGKHRYALFMIEDMAKRSLARAPVPMCVDCKNISQ